MQARTPHGPAIVNARLWFGAQQLTARPARSSKPVSRRNKICAMHPLSAVNPVAGQTESTGDAKLAPIPLDFNAVRGCHAQ
eukprot:8651410-Pyramimonas_sp.AAC.1